MYSEGVECHAVYMCVCVYTCVYFQLLLKKKKKGFLLVTELKHKTNVSVCVFRNLIPGVAVWWQSGDHSLQSSGTRV